jgi:undecaprenyl-diphosphatase
MSLIEAAILGIVQGLTEFLPVSSSGHLVLVQELFEFNPKGITFEIEVHFGSLLAVLIYFRKKLWEIAVALLPNGAREGRDYILFLILGTIPAGVIGVLFKDYFEKVFASPVMTSIFLFLTGIILLTTRFVKYDHNQVSLRSSIFIGLAQACAILPGVSRSGSTIVTGIWAKVDPAKAAEFSFLLSIPAIAGAAILNIDEFLAQESAAVAPYLLAGVLSLFSSLAAIHWLLKIIKKGRLELFAYYCFAAGALGLYLFSK